MRYTGLCNFKALCIVLGLLFTESALNAGPGFGAFGGLRRKTLNLQTRQPALVRLSNTSIGFKNAFTNPEYAPVVNSLATALGTELVTNEKTLIEKEDPKQAMWVLQLTVTGYGVGQPSQRTEATGNTSLTYVHWSGSLNAAYQVIDKEGRVHDAGNVSSVYNHEFPLGATGTKTKWGLPGIPTHHTGEKAEIVPNSPEDVKQIMIHDVVEQIAARLGNTTRAVEVQMASGDPHLDRASQFFDQKLWTRALDELEKTPPFPKPEQEAYRQYDLGLAYEAISYTSASPDDQKENLLKAEEYYDKAVEMNTKEKYFVATVARTRDALARYKELEAQNKSLPKTAPAESVSTADAMNNSKKPGSDATATSTAPDPTPAKLLTVNDVIEMYNAKAPQDQIIEVIRSSSVDFNPHDKDTVIAMAKAKLPQAIQNALRTKVGAATAKSAPVAKAPATKAE